LETFSKRITSAPVRFRGAITEYVPTYIDSLGKSTHKSGEMRAYLAER